MDKESPDLSHSADRDSHFLAAPHVPLLEEHVGYTVAARFHDQPLDLPYLAVGRTDGQFAVYVYLAEWDGVDGDLLRSFRSGNVSQRSRDNQPTWLGASSPRARWGRGPARTRSPRRVGASGTPLGCSEAGSDPS